jgi:peptide/nickel transport system permease protein
MLRYVLRRLLTGLVTLLGITLITFCVIKMAPGDPASIKLGAIQNKTINKADYDRLRRHFGLDKPLLVQYGLWLRRLATLDLGNSFSDSLPIRRKIGQAFWPTVSVAVAAILAALVISIPIGVWSAVRQGGVFDRVVSTLLYMLYSVPEYVMGILLILYVGVRWKLLPFGGMHSDHYEEMSWGAQAVDLVRHGAMLTFCYAFGALAYYSRFARGNLLEVIRQDYIRTARAKGLSEWRVITRHAFVNSLIPLITLLGMTFPEIIGGSVILEYMFNWPGLGRLYYDAVMQRDYPTLMAMNFITAFLVLFGTLLADLAYAVADPRIRYE